MTTVKLGARRDGALTAIEIRSLTDLGAYGSWLPSVTAPALLMYRCANARAENTGVYTNTGTFGPFRAPGFVEGTFALESAIDELAAALDIDPLALRRKNLPDRDQVSGRAFSNFPIEQCYARGAERIGWTWQGHRIAGEKPEPDTRSARFRRGMGMAGQHWGGGGGPPAYATVELNPDGTATLRTGTQDLGTGTKTVLTQVCAEELGLPLAAIRTLLGDTGSAQYAPISGGSMTVPSMAPAVRAAARNARLQLLDVAAQLFDTTADALEVRGGAIFQGAVRRSSVRELMQKLGGAMLSGIGSRGRNPDGHSIVTSGAQFAEVEVDTLTGRVRVLRLVAAHDCGRIINPLTFRSQIEGGVIQGIGYALTERRLLDGASGLQLNANLGDYKLPTIADTPQIDVLRIDIPDLGGQPDRREGRGRAADHPHGRCHRERRCGCDRRAHPRAADHAGEGAGGPTRRRCCCLSCSSPSPLCCQFFARRAKTDNARRL